MKKFATFGLAIVMLVAAVAFSFPSDVNAQGAGLVSAVLNRMERNHRDLKSLRAAIRMDKYNSQIRDTDTYQGVVLYMPATGRNAYVRVDWERPQRETLAVSNGQYTLFRPRLNIAYVGHARSGNNKVGGALDFLSMSRQQLISRFDLQYLGEETLWGGVGTTHLKLVPKGGASYKYAEVWVDGSGMPVQTKVVEKNDDFTSVRLTNLQRNAGISLDQFRLKLDSSVKQVKG